MSELAADGIPIAVTCRVLKVARQPYYRWLANPVTDAELIEANRANALFDAHGDDPEFGYRFLADEAADAGEVMAERTAWRICSTNGWFSRFGKKPRRGKGTQAGPPVHDDLVKRNVTAEASNELWLADITEYHTLEGRLYLCAIKDVFSNRIVGYSIDSRMTSRIAVNALNNAVARRGDVAACVLHTDRGSQFRSRKHVRALVRHSMVGAMGRAGAAGDHAVMQSFPGSATNSSLSMSSPRCCTHASRPRTGTTSTTTSADTQALASRPPTITLRTAPPPNPTDSQSGLTGNRGQVNLDIVLSRTAYRHPDGNAAIERIVRTLKEEAIWPNEFDNYGQAVEAILAWIIDYNTERPHASLGERTPAQARAKAA